MRDSPQRQPASACNSDSRVGIIANGLPAESYLDAGNRSAFDNGGDVVALFPDFASVAWESNGALPLVVTGPIVDRVRRQLAARHPRSRRRKRPA